MLLGTTGFIDEAKACFNSVSSPIAPAHWVTSGIAVYDTLFVELAARTGCPLLTFDKAMMKAFPNIAIRPRDLSEV